MNTIAKPHVKRLSVQATSIDVIWPHLMLLTCNLMSDGFGEYLVRCKLLAEANLMFWLKM